MRHARRWALMAVLTFLGAAAGSVAAEDHTSTGAPGSPGSPNERDQPRGAYSGGFFDDGFMEDDWFYDYYDIQTSQKDRGRSAGRTDQRYEADQLYDGARMSGLFEF